MRDKETQQMILTIIENAQTAKPSEFHFLRTWKEYKYYQGKRKSFKLLINALNSGLKRLLKKHCKQAAAGEDSINTLLAYHQLKRVRAFYEQELSTITDMVFEYEAYLLEGNYLWAYLGSFRSDEDMHDFRE